MQFERLIEALGRIATAIESSDNPHYTPEQLERLIAVQERNVKVGEDRLEVDRMHTELHLRGTAHEDS
jgi:hypothetical protein